MSDLHLMPGVGRLQRGKEELGIDGGGGGGGGGEGLGGGKIVGRLWLGMFRE